MWPEARAAIDRIESPSESARWIRTLFSFRRYSGLWFAGFGSICSFWSTWLNIGRRGKNW